MSGLRDSARCEELEHQIDRLVGQRRALIEAVLNLANWNTGQGPGLSAAGTPESCFCEAWIPDQSTHSWRCKAMRAALENCQ